MGHVPFAAVIAAAIFFGIAPPASAQPTQAGVSAAVRGQVALARASRNIVGRQVQSGDAIFLGDAITSGKDSGLQILLLDETVFSIGPNSEISIDQFVYDPSTGAGKVTASIAKGIFRFITGKIARKRPEDMTVRLPTATIGIRGTIVAGAVRAAPGRDARVDAAFDGLKGLVPNVGKARDFVVLLGPGDENNTNDEGGRFVYTPRGGESAARGRNAGAHLAGGGGATVSRTGFAVASDPAGNVYGPFPAPPGVTQGMTQGLSAQPPGGAKRKSSAGNAREARGAGDANSLSGNTLAQAAGRAFERGRLSRIQQPPGDQPVIPDPGAFSFEDLRQISTGSATFSGGLDFTNGFAASSSFFQFNFSVRQFQFDLNSITGPGIVSAAQVGCFSGCSIDYGGLTGNATFTPGFINGQANIVNSGCNGICLVTIGVTNATSNSARLNVNFQNGPGGPQGSAPVTLQ